MIIRSRTGEGFRGGGGTFNRYDCVSHASDTDRTLRGINHRVAKHNYLDLTTQLPHRPSWHGLEVRPVHAMVCIRRVFVVSSFGCVGPPWGPPGKTTCTSDRRAPGSSPGIMPVDVFGGACYSRAVERSLQRVVDGGLDSEATEVCLASSGRVVTFGTADETALVVVECR